MEFDKYGHKGDTLVCPYYPDVRIKQSLRVSQIKRNKFILYILHPAT